MLLQKRFHFMLPYNDKLKVFSTELRNNLTDAEQKLWFRLRRKQVLGVQFYRQKPIVGYIAYFYCAAANLVIELDGSQHFEEKQHIYDEKRTLFLQQQGLNVLRLYAPNNSI